MQVQQTPGAQEETKQLARGDSPSKRRSSPNRMSMKMGGTPNPDFDNLLTGQNIQAAPWQKPSTPVQPTPTPSSAFNQTSGPDHANDFGDQRVQQRKKDITSAQTLLASTNSSLEQVKQLNSSLQDKIAVLD